jgi:hypothetical protein
VFVTTNVYVHDEERGTVLLPAGVELPEWAAGLVDDTLLTATMGGEQLDGDLIGEDAEYGGDETGGQDDTVDVDNVDGDLAEEDAPVPATSRGRKK